MRWSRTDDVQQRTGLGHLLRQLDILGRGGRIAARVVVHQHQRGTVLANRLSEELADADDSRIQAAAIDVVRANNMVLGVEQEDAKMLLAKRAHLSLDQVGDVERRADLWALARVQAHQPPPELEGCLHFDRLYLAHAIMLTQFGDARGANPAQPAECSEQPVRKVEHVAGPPAGPQNDGQQLGIGERTGSGMPQPFAWPHRLGEVFQPDPVFSQAWRG